MIPFDVRYDPLELLELLVGVAAAFECGDVFGPGGGELVGAAETADGFAAAS